MKVHIPKLHLVTIQIPYEDFSFDTNVSELFLTTIIQDLNQEYLGYHESFLKKKKIKSIKYIRIYQFNSMIYGGKNG